MLLAVYCEHQLTIEVSHENETGSINGDVVYHFLRDEYSSQSQSERLMKYTVVYVESHDDPTITPEYKEVTALSRFVDEVNEMINIGWQPLGGLVIHRGRHAPNLVCQAMIKD